MRKLVNLLIRKDGLSHESFVDYWLNEHAPLAEALPGVRRYTTSLPADSEKAVYDGIAELYIDGETGIEEVFASDAGERLQIDAEQFLDTDAGAVLIVDETVHFTTQ
jgi:uncharacterized protein (TIGR02118 family)